MIRRGATFPALTGLRFFAASYVVLHHGGAVWEAGPAFVRNFARTGFAAVSLFYVLSGFVLTWTYAERYDAGTASTGRFLLARLARVYPLYLLAHAWEMVVQATAMQWTFADTVKPAVVGALALQAWYPPYIWRTNIPGWSISNEVFFYLAFPLLVTRLLPGRGALSGRRGAWLVLGFAWAVSFVPYAVIRAQGVYDAEWVRFAPLCRLPEFVMGMALGRLALLEALDGQPRSGVALSLVGGLGMLAATQWSPQLPYPLLHNGLLAPFYVMLVLGLARGGWPARLFAHRATVFLGEASYALYILQAPLWETMLRWVDFGAPATVWRTHALYWGALLALAVAAYLWVERPARAALKGAPTKVLWGTAAVGAVALAGVAVLAVVEARARGWGPPVILVGDFQGTQGCLGNHDVRCTATRLSRVPRETGDPWAGAPIYRGDFALPAGAFAYHAVVPGLVRQAWGARGALDGEPVRFSVAQAGPVTFLYSHRTHGSATTADVVTVPGSFQRLAGCARDWDPGCVHTWLEDLDGDGVYEWETAGLPAGRYEVKAAVGLTWAENYGAGGARDGANIGFEVVAGQAVRFRFTRATGQLEVSSTQ